MGTTKVTLTQADPATGVGGGLAPGDTFCVIKAGEALATLRPDGTIELGAHYTPTTAAKYSATAISWYSRPLTQYEQTCS